MKMRPGASSSVARQRNTGCRVDGLSGLDKESRIVSIEGDIPVPMVDSHQLPVTFVLAGK